jgi:hypothetical protein
VPLPSTLPNPVPSFHLSNNTSFHPLKASPPPQSFPQAVTVSSFHLLKDSILTPIAQRATACTSHGIGIRGIGLHRVRVHGLGLYGTGMQGVKILPATRYYFQKGICNSTTDNGSANFF